MNYFEQEQLAKIRVKDAQRASERIRLVNLAFPRFRAWRWRVFGEWLLGGLALLGLCVWVFLGATAQGITRPIRARRAERQLIALAEDFRQCHLVDDVETIKV
jgi:hypothetical protein